MKIARYDYPAQFGEPAELLERMRKALLAGRYVLSDEVRAFETELASYLGAHAVLGVNCGTDALILALRAAGIGPGDEVITQANTFHATVAAIVWSGAEPVLVDADARSFAMASAQLEEVRTSRTKAVLPVHLYGRPAPMQAVLEFARRHGLTVIEDAAQAIGARCSGVRVGTLGDYGCFSFHPSKNLAAAGDAGAIALSSDAAAARVSELRALGQSAPNQHERVGLNSKLDALQALVLSWKLPSLDEWNASRRRIAASYRERLAHLPLEFQSESPDDEHAYHLLQGATPERDKLLEHLRADGVDAVVRYPQAIHEQPAFAHLGWKAGQFPVAERLARELLALPIRPGMPDTEIDWVCNSIERYFSDAR